MHKSACATVLVGVYLSSALASAAPPDPTCVYFEDFRIGAAGWVPRDLSEQGIYWHQTIYNDGVQDRGVMWCGTDDPSYVTPPGYGHGWLQYLTKSFSLPEGLVSLDYVIQYDTEVAFDFCHVEVSVDDGDTWVPLMSWDGDSDGFVSRTAGLSDYAGEQVDIRFSFTSDGGWDDEDGLHPTDGGCRLDQVQVTGYALDDFDTGADGWVASTAPLVGRGAAFRLEYEPACSAEYPCQDYCNSWVAYDAVTEMFPFTPVEEEDRGRALMLTIESPVINIPSDATTYSLEYDVYQDLPVTYGVYYSFEVAAPPPAEGGQFVGDDLWRWGTGGFIRRSEDITALIEPGATKMQIRLMGGDLGFMFGFDSDIHTAAPFFDNVAVIATGTAASGVDCTARPCGTERPTAHPWQSGNNRYLSFSPANEELEVALSVTLMASNTYPGSVGQCWWVGVPGSGPSSASVHATLQCSPAYLDWSLYWDADAAIHVGDANILPDSTYEIRAIESGRATDDPGSYTAPLVISTPIWGDVVGLNLGDPPDGIANFVDISATVDGFRNVASAASMWALNVAPEAIQGCSDPALGTCVNFVDINYVVDGFRNLPYPFNAPPLSCACPY